MHIKTHCYCCIERNLQIHESRRGTQSRSTPKRVFIDTLFAIFVAYFNDSAVADVSWKSKTYLFCMSINASSNLFKSCVGCLCKVGLISLLLTIFFDYILIHPTVVGSRQGALPTRSRIYVNCPTVL
jgi:hypothetical protein